MVLFDSEGDILMSMGQLATIAEQCPANFYHFILDNEVYATTGGAARSGLRNMWITRMIAKGAGYPRAFNSSELDEFSVNLPGILKAPGPVFVAPSLAGGGEHGDRTPACAGGSAVRICCVDLREALGSGVMLNFVLHAVMTRSAPVRATARGLEWSIR